MHDDSFIKLLGAIAVIVAVALVLKGNPDKLAVTEQGRYLTCLQHGRRCGGSEGRGVEERR